MVVNRKEIVESIDAYLGEQQKEILKTIDFKTLKMFIKAKIKLGVSYIVKGDNKILTQFKAFYLANSAKGKERLKYGSKMISDYASILSSDSKDDLGVDDVLFIYAHRDNIDIGNTDNWLNQTVLNEVVNRKIKGYVTIILSERSIPFLEESKQFEVLNFGIVMYRLKKAEAIQNVQQAQIREGSSNSGTVDSHGTNYS